MMRAMLSFELPFLQASVLPGAAGLAVWLTGFGVCLSLVATIGAQNLYVLRQAVQGRHVGACVAWCIASDLVLIGLGVAGMGRLIQQAPLAGQLLAVGGAAFLLAYGVYAWRRAWRGGASLAIGGVAAMPGVGRVLAGLVALTLLNPHVYLDTVVLVGSIGAQQPADLRGVFVAGAACASTLWFVLLAVAGRRLRAVFASPHAWRVLDGATGAMMFALAAGLLRGAF
ncbi:MAG: Arginine exporter protein ArgO [Paracidovorax wautersii]|uniref:Arginine exporter protein ArgO n=1 Tax=Paracidovorax wautersii TaxID=1177982 RepID=A0A7V8JQY4_9BURK|nr:MAG: Arginine exporter protein ArgO [Paracidovorax wautersii]